MGSKFDFIVQVLGGEAEMAPAFRGTGLLIASDRVLTCRHVVVEQTPYGQPTDAPLPQIWVQRAAGPRLLVEKPVLATNWDLAVLELATALPVEPPPFLWGLSQALEERLRATPLFVIGYAQTEPQGPLWQHSLKDLWLLPSARESSQILTAVQLHGGIPAGCSGAPVLLPLGEHWACAGMVYLGGERSATSRLILADPVVEFLHQVGIHSIARLDAVRVLAAVPLDLAAAAALIEQPIDTAQLPNPYRGLAAFRAVDAPYFFGRQADTEDLLRAVLHHPLVTLVGASGSGKSSLIFAGLVPQLRQQNRWLLAAFRPKSDPFGELARPLIPYLYPSLADRLEQEAKRLVLAHTLIQQRLSLIHVVDLLAEEHPEQRLLLIADQFEELYTQNLPSDQQRRFLDNLLALVQRQEQALPGTLLLSLRADFLNQALSYGPLADALDHYPKKILGPLTEPALRAAIEGPAAQLGVRLEAGLSDRILQDLGQEPGSLPLLEFALTEMWERQVQATLTHQSYEAIGGVTEALAHYADKVLQRFQGQEAQLRRIFTQLVRPGEGTEDTRQLATRKQVGEANWPLIQQLADQRLVVTSCEDISDKTKIKETVEVVHEALIRYWQPLRDWIDQNRQFRVFQNRLRQSLRDWEENHRDDGALLRGARLAEAEERLKAHRDILTPAEQDYIAASLAQRNREAKARRRRTRITIASLAAGLLITLGLLLWVNVARQEATHQRVFAEVREKEAKQAQAESEQQRNVAQAREHEAKQARRLALARQLAAQATQALTVPPTDLVKGALLAAESLNQAHTLEGYQVWEKAMNLLPRDVVRLEHDGEVDHLAFSPDGKYLATTVHQEANTAAGRAELWDTVNKKHLADLTHGGWLTAVAFSQDGHLLATASWDHTVAICDALTGQEIHRLIHDDPVWGLAFRPNGRQIATGSRNGAVRVWDTTTGKALFRLQHDAGVQALAFSPDGRYLATASDDQTARLWSADSGTELHRLPHPDKVFLLAFSPSGQQLATLAAEGKTARLWDSETGHELFRLQHEKPINDLIFTADGSHILTAGQDQAVKIWDAATGKALASLKHNASVWAVAVSPNERHIATISAGNNEVIIWDFSQGRDSFRLSHRDQARAVTFSPDSKLIATASDDQSVRLWDPNNGKEIARLDSGGTISHMVFSPDG